MKVRVNSAEVITRQYKNGRRAGQQYKYVLFHLGPVNKYQAGSSMNETFYRMFNQAVVDTWDAIQGSIDPANPSVKVINAINIKEALTSGILEQDDLHLGTMTPMATAIDVVNMPLEGSYLRHDGNGNPVTRADGTPVVVDSVELVLMKYYDDTENVWKYTASDDPQVRLNWLLENFYTPAGTQAPGTVEAPAVAAPQAAPSAAMAAAAPGAPATPIASV